MSYEKPSTTWAAGRMVAIRGDVPSRRYDPVDSVLLHTEEDRIALNLGNGALNGEIRERDGAPPEWMELDQS